MPIHWLISKMAQMTPCPAPPRSPSSTNFSLQIKSDGEGPSLSSWLWTEAFIELLCVSMGKTKPYLNNKKWKSFPGQTVSSIPWLAEQSVDIKCNCLFSPQMLKTSPLIYPDTLTDSRQTQILHAQCNHFLTRSAVERGKALCLSSWYQHFDLSNFSFFYLCEKQSLEE